MISKGLRLALCAAGAAALILTVWSAAAPAGQNAVRSRAYVGHENDGDIGNFVRAYPKAAGTRLDDCQTCHRAGATGTDTEREFNPCGYCHLLQYPNPRYKTGVPKSYEDTLNAFGLAYKKAGRAVSALTAIAGQDSDGDGAANGKEIAELRYPGDPASRPGQRLAPVKTLSMDKVRRLARRDQFMLMNTTKEPTDDYVVYRGVRFVDLLKAAGVDLRGAEGITVFAPDGYSIDYTIDDVLKPFPKGRYYAGPGTGDDAERFFVKAPARLPAGVTDGGEIPGEPWLLLAYERDGRPLDPATYEAKTGRLAGEGPFRAVKPQRDLAGDPAKPGRPDRASKAKVFGDGWDFNAAIDHNAGACVRGACVIRVNPAPAGLEEYDWKNGWPLVAEKKIVIFGRGIR